MARGFVAWPPLGITMILQVPPSAAISVAIELSLQEAASELLQRKRRRVSRNRRVQLETTGLLPRNEMPRIEHLVRVSSRDRAPQTGPPRPEAGRI